MNGIFASKKANPTRILHCPTTVGGNPQGLARAERELGLASWAITFQQNYFQYKTDEVLVKETDNRLQLELKRWQLLYRAIKNFDIIHFNFGSSIMPQRFIATDKTIDQYNQQIRWLYQLYTQFLELRDLPLLKKLGKGIVVTYQGSDARQEDFCQTNFKINFFRELKDGSSLVQSDDLKRHRISQFAKYADQIYTVNPDLIHVLPSKTQFIPYSHIDLKDWQVINKCNSNSNVPIVLHAPSNRGIKGTRFILDAVSRLKSENISFEFILVEGLSNIEARKMYEKADLLIDQLLAGWYGGLAVELMALGKPVICYLREGDLKFIPEQMRMDLPLINATPDSIYDVLKQWLTVDKDKLVEQGKRSRAYVEKWHDPMKIATQMKQEYELILSSKKK